jgi:hypothetical protein
MITKSQKTKLKGNIRFIFSCLVFFFGLGVIVLGQSIETKFLGLVYILLSLR